MHSANSVSTGICNAEFQDAKLTPIQRTSARDFYGPNECCRILKNVVVLGLSFTLVFSAYKGMLNLQSSVNSQAGLGTYCLAIWAGTLAISSLFLPPFCLAKLQCKWTILLSTSGFIFYQAAQFYPRYETMVPAALFLGICNGPFWTAQSTYITIIADEYAVLKGQQSEPVLQHFFGIFYLLFQSSQIFGNVLSSVILSLHKKLHNQNVTRPMIHDLDRCGANFCGAISVVPSIMYQNTRKPDFEENTSTSKNIDILVCIFVACTVGAILIIYFFVDSLNRYGEKERLTLRKEKWYSLILATIKHWKEPNQILLIPFTIWFGIQEAFLGAEFTKGYITCALGVDQIGYVMICFGVCAALASLIVGKLTQYVGCLVIFLIAASLNAGCLITMLYWKPTPSDPILFFVLAGLWGIADGIWTPQIKAFYGTLFPNSREAGFSNTFLWMSVGFVIVYLSSEVMCMESKLYMNLGFLVLAMIGYGVVEIRTRLHLAEIKQAEVGA